jgi:hypothetical protein
MPSLDQTAAFLQLTAKRHLDFGAHLNPELRIEIRQRLVEKKYLGIANDGPAHRHTLTLPSRELLRVAIQQICKTQDLSCSDDFCTDFGLRNTLKLERKAHILGHSHVRIECVALKDHGNVTIFRLKVVDHAAGDIGSSHVPLISCALDMQNFVHILCDIDIEVT